MEAKWMEEARWEWMAMAETAAIILNNSYF
jgi:hypothetical protein